MAKKKNDIKATDKQIATFAKALGHPTRVAIIQFLRAQESCYFGDIHDVFPHAKATVSQHLKELRNAGLIQGEIEAPKVRYCINEENWEIARNLFGNFFHRKYKEGNVGIYSITVTGKKQS